jgi:hypothetical protein
MSKRMRYLQTVLKSLRAELSTTELISNPDILKIIHAMELHLRQMEVAYVGGPTLRR